MKLAVLAVSLTLVGFVQRPADVQSVPVGVLIGLWHHPDVWPPSPPVGPVLNTVWMAIERPVPAVDADIVRIPDLLIPRRTGFWRAGFSTTCAEPRDEGGIEADLSSSLWFAPDGRERQARAGSGACKAREVRCATTETDALSWVWPDYFSSNRSTESGCGANPGSSSRYAVRSIDRPQERLPIAAVLGQDASSRMNAAYEAAKRSYLADWKTYPPEDVPPFDPSAWRIERVDGAWRARAWVETHRLAGAGFEYGMDGDLSSVTGRSSVDTDALRRMTQSSRDVVDVHSGPSGWLLAITGTELRLVSPTGRIAARVPLRSHETVVMVEWAAGGHVRRWAGEVRRARR